MFFTNLSTGTCTISSGNTGAKSINCTGFTGTLAGSAAITVSGSVTLVAGMTVTYSGTLTLNGTGTLTTAGKTLGPVTINGSGITVTLGDALNIGGNALTVTQGTFNTANYSITAFALSSTNNNIRTITLGSSTLTLSANQPVDFLTPTNLTFNAGTSQINVSGTTAEVRSGGQTFYNLSYTNTTANTRSIFSAESGSTFNNISVAGPATAGVVQLNINAPQVVVNGTLSTTGTAGNRRVWFRSNTYGIAQTLTINSAPSLTDADFRDIYVIGTAAPISGTRVGDLRGCRGITFDTPKTVYWNLAAGGNWSANAWAASSGAGVSTNNFPLAQDTAVIENTGLNTSATVQIDSALATHISSVNMSTRTNAMTITMNVGTTCYGNWTNGSGTSVTGFVTLTFSGRNTQTITSAGKTFAGGITVDTYGGTVELADALNIGGNTLTITNGTLDTKNYNVTAGSLSSSNSNVRTITLGSSTITSAGTTPINFATSTNLTFNAGTSSFNFTSSIASINGGAGVAFYNVTLGDTSANSRSVLGANTFNNLTVPAGAAAGSIVQVSFNANQTITGTLTVAGATAVRRIFVRSDTLGTTRTLTVGTLAATDCDFRDITIAGTAAGSSPTRAGDCGGNSGITFPAAKTVYWNLAGAQSWSATAWAPSSGGSPDINNFPLAQDTAVFDDTGSAGTVTINTVWNIGTFDASARTSAMTFSTGITDDHKFYGDLTFSSSVTITTGGAFSSFSGNKTQTINLNGASWGGGAIQINKSPESKLQLAAAIALATRSFNLNTGEFDAVTYNVTAASFTASAGTRLRMGSGTWTLAGTSVVWSGSTSVNFYKGTADIVLSNTSTSARTFEGGGLSYNKLTIGGTTGTSTLTINGNNQFTELASTKTVAHTIALGTTTQTFGKWTVTGTAGNVVTLTGTGTSHVIAGSATSGIDYLAMGSIGFSAVTSLGEFYAGANSTGTAAAPVYRTAPPAARTLYWVGGTGNWSDTARWDTSSGGGGGAAIPTSLDDVVFDAASNATAYTSTVNANIRCNKLTIAGPTSGNVTLAGSFSLIIHDDVTLPATGLTRTFTGALYLSGSTSGKTITTNGVTLASGIIVNGVGCEWALGSELNTGNNSFIVTNGLFDCDTYNLTANVSSDNGNSRTIDFGSGTITILGSTPLTFGTTETNAANLTVTAGTAQINCSASSPTFSGNGKTFYNVAFTSTSAGTVTINGANTFNNLSFTGITSAGLKIISVTANQTITGTFTCSAGTNATMRHFVRSDTIGTARTLTCAAVSLTDVDFRDITIAGVAAPATGTRIGDCKGNSGITFTAAANKYWNLAAGGNWGGAIGWATGSGGTPNINDFPLAQDTCFFEATGLNSGATITINQSYNIGTIDMSARTTNTMTLACSLVPDLYGNWLNGTGTTLSGVGTIFFRGRGNQTITSAGVAYAFACSVISIGGSVTLQDAFVGVRGIAVNSGIFDANGYNVTVSTATIETSVTTTRTIAVGSGTWTLGSSGTVWNATTSTNLTVTGTGTISLTSASAKTFAGGGKDYSGITLNQGGAGTLTISGNNTFANITNTYKATGATAINFGTTTQRVGSFTATGEAGRVLTLTGTSASSPATLVLTSGTVTAPDYLTITGIRAYDLNTTWYAGANSTNNGSLGWLFEASGGTTFNVSFSDTATGSDAVSASFAFNASFSDTATGADTVSAGPAFNVSFSDTATGADTVAVAASTFGAAISDTATGADAVSSTGTFNVSVSDTATSADTVAVAASTFGAAFSDTATGVDAFSATAAFSAAFSDTATGADSLLAGLSFSAAFSDTATGADAVSTIATLGVEFSDAATGADAVSAAATLNVFFSDTASGLDAPAVAASTFNASFSASAIGQDTPAVAGSTFSVSLSETGAITDVVVGGYLWNPIDDTQSANWQNVITAQSPGWVQINDAQGPNWVEIQT